MFFIPAIHQGMQFIWMILEVIILPFNFQLPLTISDHIIETLNHNNTNEDSSNPGEDEFFSFIVDTESNSAASDNTAETETERTHLCTNGEFDKEHEGGTSAII